MGAAVGQRPGRSNDPHPTGVTSTLYELAVVGGLVLAGLIKMLLRCSWRRLTAPRRGRRHFRRTVT